jgi:hypothetical protein
VFGDNLRMVQFTKCRGGKKFIRAIENGKWKIESGEWKVESMSITIA